MIKLWVDDLLIKIIYSIDYWELPILYDVLVLVNINAVTIIYYDLWVYLFINFKIIAFNNIKEILYHLPTNKHLNIIDIIINNLLIL